MLQDDMQIRIGDLLAQQRKWRGTKTLDDIRHDHVMQVVRECQWVAPDMVRLNKDALRLVSSGMLNHMIQADMPRLEEVLALFGLSVDTVLVWHSLETSPFEPFQYSDPPYYAD